MYVYTHDIMPLLGVARVGGGGVSVIKRVYIKSATGDIIIRPTYT